MIHFLYHLQKDARNKPLLVTLLLFAGISLFSFVIQKGRFSFPLILAALVYAAAGFWLFWSGRISIFHVTLAVTLTLIIIAALKLMIGTVPLIPGITALILIASLLLTRAVFRTLPESPQAIFLYLLSSGLLSTLALSFLLRAYR